MKKKSVFVVFGGQGSEHSVSLRSAYTVLEAMSKSKYIIYKIGISRDGQWYLFEGENDLILNDQWLQSGKNSPISIDFCEKHFMVNGSKLRPDIVLPILHGDYGEDGKIASLFELLNVKIVGCPSDVGALCMDKMLCKLVAMAHLVPIVPYTVVSRTQASGFECDFDGDVFVKPTKSGSSLGVTRARGVGQISSAIDEALKYSRTALIEKAIDGFECEVALTEINGKLSVSEVGQIIHKSSFYDYETKYSSNLVKYKIPAKISEECRDLCKKYAEIMFRALGCRGLCRADFFVSNNEVYFNEVNTMPGFTLGSMYPMLLKHQGYKLSAIIDLLIGEALR